MIWINLKRWEFHRRKKKIWHRIYWDNWRWTPFIISKPLPECKKCPPLTEDAIFEFYDSTRRSKQ